MKQIRYNTFETNSSSTHSLVICTEKEFEDLKSGKLYIIDGKIKDLAEARKYIEKYYSNHLGELDELIKLEAFDQMAEFLNDYDIETYENWKDYKHACGLETYSRHFESPSGDKLVAWGHYGYNG